MPPEVTTGWDVGGAHLKVAQVDASGRVHTALQVPCTLWLGVEHLHRAIEEALAHLHSSERHGVTMTGELADLFADREEGVARIVEAMQRFFARDALLVYAGAAGFVAAADAVARARDVASANWHASARFAAARGAEGMLVDIGSTTTDLVPFAGGEPLGIGVTDGERLAAGELVYTGVTRTPVMAIARSVACDGVRVPLMAELFATAADVHRLTGALPDDADQHPTADGRGRSEEESVRRLARMLGRDASSASLDTWRCVARELSEQQLRCIHDAAAVVLSREQRPANENATERGARERPPAGNWRAASRRALAVDAPVVGAGVGRFLAVALAERLGLPYVDFASLIEGTPETREWAARCAPAVAVAALVAHAA
jgi:probable H4MPT-linked C1 transfer pathway protein